MLELNFVYSETNSPQLLNIFVSYSQGIKSDNFVVFSQLVGAELPRGVASILVVPCQFGYRTYSKYH